MRQKLKECSLCFYTLLSACIGGPISLIALIFWMHSSPIPKEPLAEGQLYTFQADATQRSQKATHSNTLTSLSVVTYNIGYLSGMANNLPVDWRHVPIEEHLKSVERFLSESKPDIIALQEIDFDSERSHRIDMLDKLAASGNFSFAARAINWSHRYVPFPYWPPTAHFARIVSGQAILSRYPITSHDRIVLPKPADNTWWYNLFYLDRLIQAVTLQINGRPLHVVNLHLEAYKRDTREHQAKIVARFVQALPDEPVLLLGDFNTVPPTAAQKHAFKTRHAGDFRDESTYESLLRSGGFHSATADLSPRETFTFPADRPDRQVDHILYNHWILPEAASIASPGGRAAPASDHLPVLFRFKIRTSNEE